MLARLDEELAPLRASVDGEGTVLRVEGTRGDADLASRIATIVEQMGYFATPIDASPEVPRWYGSRDVDELSQEEAEILAERWVREIAAEDVIDHAGRLTAPLRAALLEEFRRAARSGSVDAIRIDRNAFRDVLTENEAEQVGRWIASKLGESSMD